MNRLKTFEEHINESISNLDADKFIKAVEKEMSWNHAKISALNDKSDDDLKLIDNVGFKGVWKYAFSYTCLPGSGITKDLRAAIKKIDPSLKPDIRRGFETSRRADYHDYYIIFK